MKILLLNPFGRDIGSGSKKIPSQYLEEPLGLMYIYSYLKLHAPVHDLQILDASILLENSRAQTMEPVWKDLEKNIASFGPDLVGISALYYANSTLVGKSAELIKKIDPRTIVVLGGSYPTLLPQFAMKIKEVDFCVLSEGEESFLALVKRLSSGQPVENIDGIAYRTEQGVVVNPKQHFVSNIDDIPFPDRTALPFSQYLTGGRRVLYRYFAPKELRIGAITSTRGCPYQCTFCGSKTFWGQRIRFRSPENIVEEMLSMCEEWEINTFVFNDDNQCVNAKHFMKVLDLILDNLPPIRWHSGGGINVRAINSERIIKKMIQSGICLFDLAIESGSNDTLKKVKKPVTVEESENVVKLIRRYSDVPISGYFIIGFPWETKKEMNETLDFAKKLKLDWTCIYNFQPFPGSELYDDCIENNLINEFDLNYGENFLPSNVHYEHFTPDDVARINYDANIDINFINNPNLEKNPKRALGDFNYVLTLVPDHLIAVYCKGLVHKKLGNLEKAETCFKSAKNGLSGNSFFYKYFEKYKLIESLEQYD